jgi:pheromone shutdown-related protein TraB
MITLLGTGHVFDLSSVLLAIFDEKEPDVICVELDTQRYNALMMQRTHPEVYKNAEKNLPLIYKLLARFQDKVAHEYGVHAGDEMLTAVTYAHAHQLPLEFIDMNAQHLFTNMWNSMPFFEKLKLFFSGFIGLFITRKHVEQELQQFQNDFEKYIEEIGKKFPTIKKTLIDKRNAYMTDRLVRLNETYTHIIACIGDGHVPGISHLLQSKHIKFETIRLHELTHKKKNAVDATSAHFTTRYTEFGFIMEHGFCL